MEIMRISTPSPCMKATARATPQNPDCDGASPPRLAPRRRYPARHAQCVTAKHKTLGRACRAGGCTSSGRVQVGDVPSRARRREAHAELRHWLPALAPRAIHLVAGKAALLVPFQCLGSRIWGLIRFIRDSNGPSMGLAPAASHGRIVIVC